ncbi:MAG: aspartate aminotransferase family protein [Actinobacteria bacterium]|nr:aspartate aminotransferase family protein [Actinomycetota bacterium]
MNTSQNDTLPPHGWSVAETLRRLEALRSDDVRWKDGRVFSLAYYASPEAHELATEAYRRFSGENALNVEAFPSLRTMQSDVLAIVAGWLGAPATARGFFSSGGTESILMAVKAARDQFRHDESRPVTRPNVVLPTSAHAAFEKAGAYFDVEMRRVPVRSDWRADATAMAAAADDDTIMFVASSPQYPQGVVDPVAEVAAVAADRRANCHVDACMGGVTLPYLARLGVELPEWNFAVDGVTSMSVDLHKFGYAAKGASVVMYREARLRSFQGFVTDNWLGGMYGSSGVLGTKSGGPIAAAWAVLHHLGDDGYLALTKSARDTTLRIASAIVGEPQLVLRAQPDTTLLSFGAAIDPHTGAPTLDIFAVADLLRTSGWYVDRQGPPPSIHLTVNAVHAGTHEAFIADLRSAVAETAARPAAQSGDARSYGTLE